MRAVVQRVTSSNVKVTGNIISLINNGMLVLLGVSNNDSKKDIEYISDKLLNLRIFKDDYEKMNKSITDIDGEIMIVSQFTLYGDARKGRRPSYDNAANGEIAKPLYEEFVKHIKINYKDDKIQTGIFGAMMEVGLINDGPVTILLDSERRF